MFVCAENFFISLPYQLFACDKHNDNMVLKIGIDYLKFLKIWILMHLSFKPFSIYYNTIMVHVIR